MFPGETVLSRKALGEDVDKNPHIGPFKVMTSQGSGLSYIGTMFLSCGVAGCEECDEYNHHGHDQRSKGDEVDYNSRETDYFDTKEEAQAALDKYNSTGWLDKERF